MKLDINTPLTKRELEIMTIFWNAKKPLIASEITSISNGITINTIQAVLKKLLHRNYISIDKIVYSGTVLTRSYVPIITLEEYQGNYLSSFLLNLKTSPNFVSNFVANLLENEQDKDKLLNEIQELEDMLVKKKKQLES